jgi:hypothetical protein
MKRSSVIWVKQSRLLLLLGRILIQGQGRQLASRPKQHSLCKENVMEKQHALFLSEKLS